jgi:hypothetical protein
MPTQPGTRTELGEDNLPDGPETVFPETPGLP